MLVCLSWLMASIGQPSWGPALPPWGSVTSALAHRCSCPRVPQVLLVGLCWECRGLILPPAPALPKPCPWCRKVTGIVCPSCHTQIHFRGECRWNHGARPAYLANGADLLQMCPDCLCSLCDAVQALPTQQPPLPAGSALSQHMYASAQACLPGAGADSAGLVRLPLRRVRRWLLRHLGLVGSASLDQLLCALEDWAPATAADCQRTVLHRACRALQAEGRAVSSDQNFRLLAGS